MTSYLFTESLQKTDDLDIEQVQSTVIALCKRLFSITLTNWLNQ